MLIRYGKRCGAPDLSAAYVLIAGNDSRQCMRPDVAGDYLIWPRSRRLVRDPHAMSTSQSVCSGWEAPGTALMVASWPAAEFCNLSAGVCRPERKPLQTFWS